MFRLRGKFDDELEGEESSTSEEAERAEFIAACIELGLDSSGNPAPTVDTEPETEAPILELETPEGTELDGPPEVPVDERDVELEQLRAQVRAREAELLAHQAALEESDVRINALTAELEHARASLLPSFDDTAAGLADDERDALQQSLDDHRVSLAEAEQRSATLTVERDQLAADRERLAADYEQLAADYRQLRVSSDPLDVDAARDEVEHHRAKAEEHRAKAEELRTELEKHRIELDQHRAKLELSEARITALAADVDSARRDAEKHRASAEAAEQLVAALTAELDQLRTNSIASAEESTAALGAVQTQLAEHHATVDHLHERLREAQERTDEIATEHVQLSGELAASLQAQSAAAAEIATLQRAADEQRAWYDDQLARVREMESRQAAAAEQLRVALAERTAEVSALQQQLLESEMQRAEEAASLLAYLGHKADERV